MVNLHPFTSMPICPKPLGWRLTILSSPRPGRSSNEAPPVPEPFPGLSASRNHRGLSGSKVEAGRCLGFVVSVVVILRASVCEYYNMLCYLDWCQGLDGCTVALPPKLDLGLRVGDMLGLLGVAFDAQHPRPPDLCPNEELQSHALAAQRRPSGALRASPVAHTLPLLRNAPPWLLEMS